MKLSKLLDINLTLFDGGDGASSGEGGGNSGVTGETMAGSVVTQQNNSGEGGTQDAVSTTNKGSDAVNNKADVKPTFNDLINGEYKEEYTKKVQSVIDRRFKEVKTLEDTVKKNQDVIDRMMQRYKIADGDVTKLAKALDDDATFWEAEADEAGVDVDTYKNMKRMERELNTLRREKEEGERKEAERKTFEAWFKEADKVKETYPDFDFAEACKNQEFLSMLRVKIPMQHAYEVLHLGEIKSNVAQSVAKETEKQVVDNVRSKGTRPSENGTTSQSGFTVKKDVSSWSKEDMKDVIRRVQRGEIIKL